MLHDKVRELKEKMDELRHRRILLLSRVNAATSFDTDNIANGFARAEERILFMEAGVKASRSLSWPTQPLPTHQIHSTMEEEVQQALGKLKETIKEKGGAKSESKAI
jgi:phage shock protein A